ncbi:hypothetical protein NCC78_01965 [Micromonospora phytophila]|uniref:hypothetical protein n=1 Tax=Micromonospora phytophila TaxID=709888 RepID=UPI00202E251E|nr:hypothetical protein [Micromonospora phytophila]MCM0673493.1 hypothetical protein [Micromonospora phytophila]
MIFVGGNGMDRWPPVCWLWNALTCRFITVLDEVARWSLDSASSAADVASCRYVRRFDEPSVRDRIVG